MKNAVKMIKEGKEYSIPQLHWNCGESGEPTQSRVEPKSNGGKYLPVYCKFASLLYGISCTIL